MCKLDFWPNWHWVKYGSCLAFLLPISFFVCDFFRAGRLTLDRALDLITYLKFETHNVPLLQGLGYLESFYKMIEKRKITDVTENLKVFQRCHIGGIFVNLFGWNLLL